MLVKSYEFPTSSYGRNLTNSPTNYDHEPSTSSTTTTTSLTQQSQTHGSPHLPSEVGEARSNETAKSSGTKFDISFNEEGIPRRRQS
jgi:hypothetical protein